MTMAGDSRERVDSYLEKLRKGLAGVSREDAAEIIEELRGHILEKADVGGEITPATVEGAGWARPAGRTRRSIYGR